MYFQNEYHRRKSAGLGALLLQDFKIRPCADKVLQKRKFHRIEYGNAVPADKLRKPVKQTLIKPFTARMRSNAVSKGQIADELIIRALRFKAENIVADEFCLLYTPFRCRSGIGARGVSGVMGNIDSGERCAGR